MDIYRHKAIVTKVPEILPYVDEQTRSHLINLISESREILNSYEWKEKTIIHATPTELGRFSASAKKILYNHLNIKFGHIAVRIEGENEQKWWDGVDAVEEMVFTQDLINAKILLMRRINSYDMDHLDRALNESIKLEIITQFEEKNKELINKNPNK